MEHVLAGRGGRVTDLRVLSLRYFNPIGADPQPAHRLAARAARPTCSASCSPPPRLGEEFLLTGVDWPTRDGSGIRDFIHVWDLGHGPRQGAAALRRGAAGRRAEPYEVINLGTGSGTTVKEFVAAFKAASGQPLRVRETGPRPGDVAGSFTRSVRARELLGWAPQLTTEDGIRDSVRLVRDPRRAVGRRTGLVQPPH